MRRIRVAAIVAATLASGCSGITDAADPRLSATPGEEAVLGVIHARLTVDPRTVERTAAFTATLTLTNPATVAATWTSGSGCLAFLNVYNASGERVPLRGTDFGCLAVVTTRRLAPGETLTHSWTLVARTTDDSELPPGQYVLEADPVVPERTTLRAPFAIR